MNAVNITTDAFFFDRFVRRRRRGRVYATRLDAIRTDARLVAPFHTIVCAVSIERDYTATYDMYIFCLDVGERRLGVFFSPRFSLHAHLISPMKIRMPFLFLAIFIYRRRRPNQTNEIIGMNLIRETSPRRVTCIRPKYGGIVGKKRKINFRLRVQIAIGRIKLGPSTVLSMFAYFSMFNETVRAFLLSCKWKAAIF